MQLIFDKDEVIADLMTPVIFEYNRLLQLSLTIEDINEWKLPPGMVEIFMQPGFFLGLQPIPGAVEGLRTLRERGHDIIIATSPSKNGEIAKEKLAWIDLWLPEFKENVYLVERKDRIIGDFLCDDRPRYLTEFTGIRVCMDRPWNRHLVTGRDIDHRIINNNWLHIVDLVDSLASRAWRPERWLETN